MTRWVSLQKPKIGYRIKQYRICASLDGILKIHGGKIPFKDSNTGEQIILEGEGCVEAKSQAYNSGPPTRDNVLQVQTQMLCTGFKWAIIGKLGPRQQFSMYVYKADPELQNMIIESVQDFWNKVDNDIPYPVEETEKNKSYVNWSNDDKGLTQMLTDYERAEEEIESWTTTKNELKDAIKSILKQENCNYVQIKNKKISLELITRKATVEKLVPARPASQYEKLTVKEASND